jgi:hypothetical protein
LPVVPAESGRVSDVVTLRTDRERRSEEEGAMKRGLAVAVTAMLGTALLPGASRAQLAYGPDTCRQGFVWREAFPGDHVCVTPRMRDMVAYDNRQAPARREPGGGAYGRDTCRQGYVWREARASDHVCVSPAMRTQTWEDNSRAAARRARASQGQPIDPGTELQPATD